MPAGETIAVNKFGPVQTCRRCLNTQLKYTFGTPCPNDPHTNCGMRTGKTNLKE